MDSEWAVRTRTRARYAAMALGVALSLGTSWVAPASAAVADRDQLLTLARSERQAGHRMEALAHVQRLLARRPNDTDAQRLNIQLLSEMGASTRAAELAAQTPDAIDSHTRAQLEADRDAHDIRWANGEPLDPKRPYAATDHAIAETENLIADPHTPDDVRERARADLLVALDQGDRAAQAIDDYEAMRKAGTPVPAYAEEAVADAMMQKHRPREAIQLYRESLPRTPDLNDPQDTQARIGLVFAYLDAGENREAYATIDSLAASEPRWLHVPGVRGAKQDPSKVDTDASAATVRQDVGIPAEAYARLAALSAQAPANSELRRDLAMAELARGWPRQAEDTLHIADTLDSRDANAELDEAEVLRARGDYAGAQADVDLAVQQAARSGRVQDAQWAQDRATGWQFDLSHDNGWGNSPDYGDRDSETIATLASPLIDEHWRVLTLARYDTAALPEGNVTRERAGLGVEGFYRDIQFYVQALPAADRYVRRTALETGFTWAISDHWTLSTDWSTAGADVPLRAQYYGITGKTLNTALQWRANELTSARLAVFHDRFSDGNLRNGWLADVVQRLHTAPNFTFDGGLEIGGSRNSEIDRPYFNPALDRSYAVTSTLQNILSEYDDRQWAERFDLSVGRYMERNFQTGWMGSARYGQTYQPHGGLRFGWGVSWHNQPYDGKRESRVVLDLTMHWGD